MTAMDGPGVCFKKIVLIQQLPKFVSYMNSEEGSRTGLWGIEGDDYTVDEEGVPTFSEKYLEARNDTDKWNNDYNGWFLFWNFGD